MTDMEKQRMGALKIVLAGIAWSFAGVLGKWVPWNALSLVGFRALIAILMLGTYRKSFRIRNNAGTWMGSLGVAGTSLLFLVANKLTSAANAIVLQYAMPVFVILLCVLVFRQRPSALDLTVTFVVIVGVAMCFYQGLGGGRLLGDILAIGSALTFALVFFSGRLPGVDAADYSYQGNLIACVFLAYIPFDPSFSWDITALLVALLMGICLSLGYLLFSMGMRDGVSPVTAAIVANVEPVLNPTWVFLFMGENPGLWSILGAAVVLAAVTLYSIFKNRSPGAIAEQKGG